MESTLAHSRRLIESPTVSDSTQSDRPEPGDDRPRRETPTVEGTITGALPNAMFAVELSSGQHILARIAGTIQMRGTRLNPGDRVTVELSPYDLTRGRITRRHR